MNGSGQGRSVGLEWRAASFRFIFYSLSRFECEFVNTIDRLLSNSSLLRSEVVRILAQVCALCDHVNRFSFVTTFSFGKFQWNPPRFFLRSAPEQREFLFSLSHSGRRKRRENPSAPPARRLSRQCVCRAHRSHTYESFA